MRRYLALLSELQMQYCWFLWDVLIVKEMKTELVEMKISESEKVWLTEKHWLQICTDVDKEISKVRSLP